MNIEKELTYVAFLNREYQRSHLAYDREMEFLEPFSRAISKWLTGYSNHWAVKKWGLW